MNLIFLCLVVVWSARASFIEDNLLEAWTAYKEKFHKSYSTPEEDHSRMLIFEKNRQFVAKHNLKFKAGEVTYEVDINQFSDMRPEEFQKEIRYYEEVSAEKKEIYVPPENVTIPDEINWVEKGAVTPVRDQKNCSAGYAFSAVASLESRYYIKNKKLIKLSPQSIIDCSDSQRCHFGDPSFAYLFVVKNGLELDVCYPYNGSSNNICNLNPRCVLVQISSFYGTFNGDEEKLKNFVAEGPVSVHIFALLDDFIHYKGGIYSNPDCMDAWTHAVAVVGYGTDPKTKTDYWLIKNSWGKNWGEKGYMRLARNHGNLCGVATSPSFALSHILHHHCYLIDHFICLAPSNWLESLYGSPYDYIIPNNKSPESLYLAHSDAVSDDGRDSLKPDNEN